MRMLRVGTVALLLVAVWGCDWVTKEAPERARIQLEGQEGAQVQLITSTTFLSNRIEGDGRDNEVVLVDADTAQVTIPFEASYDISIDRRFLARVLRSDPSTDELVLNGWVDGKQHFNRPGRPVPEDSLLQIVYVFESNQLPDDDDNL